MGDDVAFAFAFAAAASAAAVLVAVAVGLVSCSHPSPAAPRRSRLMKLPNEASLPHPLSPEPPSMCVCV